MQFFILFVKRAKNEQWIDMTHIQTKPKASYDDNAEQCRLFNAVMQSSNKELEGQSGATKRYDLIIS